NLDNINQPLSYQPLLYEYNNLFVIPSNNKLYFVNKNGENIEEFSVDSIGYEDGVLYFSDDIVYTVSFDGPIIIKKIDIKKRNN
ncbi:MAG: hypothetical protein KAR38_07830, partial [Calditrichia bacterium]|nr:hypothetical protein [Calditrichia bacterium]